MSSEVRKNGQKGPRILIVDDDPGQRSLLDSFLQNLTPLRPHQNAYANRNPGVMGYCLSLTCTPTKNSMWLQNHSIRMTCWGLR